MVYARTLCFVTSGQDVLMLKGAATKRLYANLYNGVGGHLEAGEDVLACVRREVREETGLEVMGPRLRAVVNVDEVGKAGVVLFVFVACAATREVHASGEGELAWVPQNRLLKLNLVEDLKHVLPILLDARNSGVWFGHFAYDESGRLTRLDGQWGLCDLS
jgi:8-oxo-dGTP diphosphatase